MMPKGSPMLGSIYSCVKEPLRKTPSKYKDYKVREERERRHRGIGIGEGKRENIEEERT
jgi:hypothetical protein